MKAFLKNYRQSARKVRLVADLLRGKTVLEARSALKFTPKHAARQVSKLLDSVVANAKENDKKDAEHLLVKEIRVDEGPTLKRFMPRAMGRATRINKRTSHITIILGEKENNKKEANKK